MISAERVNRTKTKPAFFLSTKFSSALNLKRGGTMIQYLTLKDLAKYLNCSPSVVYKRWRRWATDGLKVFSIGEMPRFRTPDVDAWMERKNRIVLSK